MWSIDTPWLDVAIVLGIFGNILFGHFEAHRTKWRRLLKVAIILAITLTLSTIVGRGWAYGLLMALLLGAVYVHLYWLPKHGVNGWTGEPRERYLELVTKKRSS